MYARIRLKFRQIAKYSTFRILAISTFIFYEGPFYVQFILHQYYFYSFSFVVTFELLIVATSVGRGSLCSGNLDPLF